MLATLAYLFDSSVKQVRRFSQTEGNVTDVATVMHVNYGAQCVRNYAMSFLLFFPQTKRLLCMFSVMFAKKEL